MKIPKNINEFIKLMQKTTYNNNTEKSMKYQIDYAIWNSLDKSISDTIYDNLEDAKEVMLKAISKFHHCTVYIIDREMVIDMSGNNKIKYTIQLHVDELDPEDQSLMNTEIGYILIIDSE